MNTESPRLRALLAAGAALVVFGITIPATAAPDHVPGKPGVGTVGNVPDRIPPGQQVELDENADSNRGYQCDGNNGAGNGNPAHGTCGETTDPTTDPTTGNGGTTGPGTGDGDTGGDWYSES